MLATRPLGSVCLPCRLYLLALFQNGFGNSLRIAQSRASTHVSRNINSRSFNTSQLRRIPDGVPENGDLSRPSEHVEEMVRYARRSFGDTLPENFLTSEEYVIYERLYGPPLKYTTAEGTEPPSGSEECVLKNALFKENTNGGLEEVHYREGSATGAGPGASGLMISEDDSTINVEGRSSQEIEALMRLRQDMLDAMKASPAEEEDPEYEPEESEGEEDEEGDGYEDIDEPDVYASAESIRAHPHTLVGRSRTSPTTLNLPRAAFLAPIESLLANVVPKHHTEAAENTFGGKGLPYSPFSPASKKHLPQKPIALEASQGHMSDVEGNLYLSCVMPGVYAAVMSTLAEVRKRLGSRWLSELLNKEGGPRFLDAGAGGAGIIAWREVLKAEWERMREEHEKEGLGHLPKEAPLGRATAVTGSDALRYRASRFIGNTTFIPRLPDHIHTSDSAAQVGQDPATARKQFDVIVAPHTLWPIWEDFRRKKHVENLWSLLNPDGGVLILIEKGLPRGFEAVAGARRMLLSNYISSPDSAEHATEPQPHSESSSPPKEIGMIIAPCTNHAKCPMYLTPGLSSGRKDFCHFRQRYIRPPLLQRIMDASDRNHEDIKFSYLAVRRGRDERATNGLTQGQAATEAAFSGYNSRPGDEGYQSPNPLSLPRAILHPIKRHKHVLMDVCTPAGQIERWIIPRSFGKQAYRDASKSWWGDLWPLGAKTRIPRKVRVGRGEGSVAAGKRRVKKKVFEVEVGDGGMEGVRELVGKRVRKGKRDGKRGRKAKVPREITGDEF